MKNHSIREAARLVGISRSQFYEDYINVPGVLSVDRTNPKRPTISTTELLRVFGELKGETVSDHSQTSELDFLEEENKHLKSLIQSQSVRLSELKDSLTLERERSERYEARYFAQLEAKEATPSPSQTWIEKITKHLGSWALR